MSKRRSTLTGSWSGAYRYPRDADPETVFNAQIEEVGGALIGEIQEPNLFLDDAATVLMAEIEGVRTGASVVFTKFYRHNGIRHAIRYEGLADEALLRIDGKWIIPRAWSGTFFMQRDDDAAAAEAETHAEIKLGRSS